MKKIFVLAFLLNFFCSTGLGQERSSEDNFAALNSYEITVAVLEGARLRALLSGGVVERNGQAMYFADYFFAEVFPLLQSDPDFDFVVLESYLRELNTGMSLIAIPKELMADFFHNDSIRCLADIFGNESSKLTHAIYLQSGSLADANGLKLQLGLTPEGNAEALKTTGVATFCSAGF